MRRLLLLVCALVGVDTILYTALTPLLPHFAHDLHLSKAGAGVLVAAYAAGALVGGLPGGAAAAKLGARRAVLVGLTLMGLASLGFAFAHGFWPLAAARFAARSGKRLHLGGRLRVAARGGAARAPRRADRYCHGRGRVRRAASGRSSARRPPCSVETWCSRLSPASRSCSPSGRCSWSPSRRTRPRWAAMRRALARLRLRRRAPPDGVAVLPLRRPLDARAAPPGGGRLGRGRDQRRLGNRRGPGDRRLTAPPGGWSTGAACCSRSR